MILAEQKQDPWEVPCVLEDLPFAQYLQIPAASSHALGTLLNKSPLHVKAGLDKPSPAKALGTLVHAMLMTPDDMDDQVVIQPANTDKSSNANKAARVGWLREVSGFSDEIEVDPKLSLGKQLDANLLVLEEKFAATGLVVCSEDDKAKAETMVGNVLAKSIGREIFQAGKAETTIMAQDPEHGVICKIRPDWLPDGHEVIVDLKSAQSASFEDFSRVSARYGYHIQAALYRSIYSKAVGRSRPPFIHAVIENEAPYDCAFYELDQAAIEAGEKRVRRALRIWKLCEESGKWPGIGWEWPTREYTIESLSLPKWAL